MVPVPTASAALNTYTGATTIGSGSTLALLGSGSIAASSGVSNSGNFSIAGATSPVSLTNLGGSGATNLGNQSLTITAASGLNSGVISGVGGSLAINGSGTYSLSGLNTYTGATTDRQRCKPWPCWVVVPSLPPAESATAATSPLLAPLAPYH